MYPRRVAWGEVGWGIFVLFYGKEHLARKFGPKSYNGKKKKIFEIHPIFESILPESDEALLQGL